MESFTEYYRLRWFAREITQGDFSYLWYGRRYTVLIRMGTLVDHDVNAYYEPNAERSTYHAGY